jgi:hypothetical protein
VAAAQRRGLVQKPFNAGLLRVRIEAALGRKRLRDQEAKFLGQLAEKAAATICLTACCRNRSSASSNRTAAWCPVGTTRWPCGWQVRVGVHLARLAMLEMISWS